MRWVRTEDGTELHVRDWGSGRAVLFCHDWPLDADSWEVPMLHLSMAGFRCVAHDRRGHGRSSQPWNGNDVDTYADDLATIIDALDLTGMTLVGFGAGTAEVVRYLSRYGPGRVRSLALVSPIAASPSEAVGDAADRLPAGLASLIEGSLTDRAQLYRRLADGLYFGHGQRGRLSRARRDSFWRQAMGSGHRNAHEALRALAATDLSPELAGITIPTLVIHGDADQLAPADARTVHALVPTAQMISYPDAPHGLIDTHGPRLSADLRAFLAR